MVELAAQVRMQRSLGEARVLLARRGPRVGLVDLHQSGSAKAMLPHATATEPEVVFLNSSGGLTGGDRIGYALTLGPGGNATATSQTAERAYASTGPVARLSFAADVGAGARLDWLPQELLLYENSNLLRETTVALAPTASVLLVESVVLGRLSMGEAPRRARLTDRRRVLRAGRLVWAETQQLTPDWLARAASPALMSTARAFATVALIGPGAEDATAAVRAALTEPGCDSATSGWDGKCITRITAREGWPLRLQIARVLAVLRRAPLPRAWQMPQDAVTTGVPA